MSTGESPARRTSDEAGIAGAAAGNRHLQTGQPVCRRCGLASPQDFRFCGYCGAPLESPYPRPAQAATSERPTPERRQLTVLFCDLVGSTKLASRLDPEDMRHVIRTYQAACTPVVRSFDGTISRYMGDGFLALFGYPRAHEDDAERAVQAGLDIVSTMAKLPLFGGSTARPEPLQVRIGVATGIVVAGDLIGEGEAEEEAVVGDTLNMAARLQTLAEPNSVVIAEATHALVGERFDYVDLGSHVLHGFGDPVRAWRVSAPRSVATRFEAARPLHLLPLVNREEYVSWLSRLWQEATRSSGRVALVTGEAGIGKSRLVRALRDQFAGASFAALRYQCSPHYGNTALYPVIAHILRAARIGREDPPEMKLAKFAQWLGPGAESAEAVALLGALLALPPDENYPLPPMSAQRRKERTLELILWFMQRLAADRSLFILFEDVQWIDPTTREFLTLLIERVREMRALVVLTFRPGFAPPWGNQAHVEMRELHGLEQHYARELALQVAADRLPQASIEQIVAKTDGVPLFVEELTRAVLNAGPDEAQDPVTGLRIPSPLLEIPCTLQDLLRARLDQIGPAKPIAQVASVIGREFSFDLLEMVAGVTGERLRESLHLLEQAGVIYVDPQSISLGYKFKHALAQDVAYQSLLKSRRRELHLRIAEALVSQFPQTTREAPELAAHHWTEAGDAERAVTAWLVAGQRASVRSHYSEAIGHLRQGLDLIARLSDPDDRRRQELALLLALGPALIIAQGAGTPEVTGVYSRALALCEGLPDSAFQFIAHWGWWRASMDHRMGRERADKLIALARGLNDRELLLQAHHCQWATLYMLGAHAECCRHIDAGLALYEPERDRVHAALYGGHDARVCALGEGALARWMLGNPNEALEHVSSARAWAHKLAHVGSRAHAMDYALVLHKFRRDMAAVHQQAIELIDFASEQRLRVFRAKGGFFRGWAQAMLHSAQDGLAEMLDSMASSRAADTPHDFTLYYEMLAEVYGRAGRFTDGLQAVDEGFAIAERHGIVFWNAELHRRRGELLAASGERERAGACFREAIGCAHSQGARALELRAAVCIARLLRAERNPQAGHAILKPLYDGFTEGFDTPDLGEARELLEVLV